MPTVPFSHVDTEGYGQNRCPVGQLAGSVQEQQQEAGGCQVLQFPGPEEAAGSGARPGGAVQRHRGYAWTSLPHHLGKIPIYCVLSSTTSSVCKNVFLVVYLLICSVHYVEPCVYDVKRVNMVQLSRGFFLESFYKEGEIMSPNTGHFPYLLSEFLFINF